MLEWLQYVGSKMSKLTWTGSNAPVNVPLNFLLMNWNICCVGNPAWWWRPILNTSIFQTFKIPSYMYIVHTSVNSDDFQSLLKRKVPRIEKQGMLKCRIYGNSYSVHSQVVYSFIETNGQHRNWINKISSFFSQFSFVSRFKNYYKNGHYNSTVFKIFII